MQSPFFRITSRTSEWLIPKECLKKFGQLSIHDRVGSGAYGSVYNVCDRNNNCDKVVKVIQLYPNTYSMQLKYLSESQINEFGDPMDDVVKLFNFEIEVTKLVSEIGISPKYYDSFICSDINIYNEQDYLVTLGFIILDKWDMTVENYLRITNKSHLPIEILQKLEDKIHLMHKNGISHGDLHGGNIVLKIKQFKQENGDIELVPIDIAIIDFGSVIRFNPNNLDNLHLIEGDLYQLNYL